MKPGVAKGEGARGRGVLPALTLLLAWLFLLAPRWVPAGQAGTETASEAGAAGGEHVGHERGEEGGHTHGGHAGHDHGAVHPTVASAPVRVKRVLYKAQLHMSREEYGEALEVLRHELGKHPEGKHCLLSFSLGNALYALEKRTEALGHFQEAVKLDAAYEPAWINLGQLAFELERYDLAADALARGYELSEEKVPEYSYYAAVAHIMAGRCGRAAEMLERLVALPDVSPEKEWYRSLLHTYLELNRQAEAERLIHRMLDLYPDDPETWKLCYRFEANRERYRQAAAAMTIYSYLTPLTREEQVLLGDLYAAVNVPLAAARWYEAAMAANASSADCEKLASAYIAAHRPEEGLRVLRGALDREPTAKLWSLLGDLLFMQEEYAGARDAFRQGARLDPGNGRLYLMAGYCSLEQGQKGEAAADLGKAAADPRQRKMAQRLLEQTRLP